MNRHKTIFAGGALTALLVLGIIGAAPWNLPGRNSDAAPVPALMGSLPKPIGEMSGKEFAALVQPIPFQGGKDVWRKCSGTADCNAGLEFTSVRIDASPDARHVRPGSEGSNGVVVVRMKNNGTHTERLYGLKPGPYEYFIVVHAGEGGEEARWMLEELKVTSTEASHATLSAGWLQSCGHGPTREIKADFKSCDDPSLHDARAQTKVLPDPGAWFGCGSGCCTPRPPTSGPQGPQRPPPPPPTSE